MPTIREQLGEELYANIEAEAEKEVALAMEFAIIDQWRQDRYYYRRSLLNLFLKEFQIFQEKGFKFTPADIFNVLFEAKLQRPCQTEKEYIQRKGGGSFMDEPPFIFSWHERSFPINEVIDRHLEQINSTIMERSLASEITHFNTHPTMGSAPEFLAQLFIKLNLPFNSEINDNTPPEGAVVDGHLPETGNISFTVTGTRSYTYYYAQAYLRNFFNILRIAGFLYKGQIDFGMWNIVIMAPTSPWFLHTTQMPGGYCWDEDKKKPWEKIPDGCLFISFGYRGYGGADGGGYPEMSVYGEYPVITKVEMLKMRSNH